MFADWQSHAIRVTLDNRQDPEYHFVVVIRRLHTDKNCLADIHAQTMSKMSSTLDLKRPTPTPKKH